MGRWREAGGGGSRRWRGSGVAVPAAGARPVWVAHAAGAGPVWVGSLQERSGLPHICGVVAPYRSSLARCFTASSMLSWCGYIPWIAISKLEMVWVYPLDR